VGALRALKEQLSRDKAEHAVDRALRSTAVLPGTSRARPRLNRRRQARRAKKSLLLTKDRQDGSSLGFSGARIRRKQRDELGSTARRASTQNWRTHLQLGQFHRRNQDYAEAEKEFVSRSATDPTSPTA
jgi:hypothetical protein